MGSTNRERQVTVFNNSSSQSNMTDKQQPNPWLAKVKFKALSLLQQIVLRDNEVVGKNSDL